MSKTFGILAAVAGVAFLGWGITRSVEGIQYERHVSSYLARAGHANKIDYAAANLETALNYLANNSLVSGYTSILYTSPDEDVGYWYQNLSASLAELKAIPPTDSELEKTNVLLKLHETIVVHSGDGDAIVEPEGISVYPYNGLFAVWGWGSISLICLFLTLAILI